MAVEIIIGDGHKVLVDEEDEPRVLLYSWFITTDHYAAHRVYGLGTHKQLYMHRLIMRAKSGQIVDHINRNKLDNRKENLRFVSVSENTQNSATKKRATSTFRGVCWDAHANKYRADIRQHGKRFACGLYTDPIDAAVAYDRKAQELFGEHALTNEKFLSEVLDKLRSKKYLV